MAHSLEEETIVTPEETGGRGGTPPGTPPEDICRKLPDGLIRCSGEFIQQALTENQDKKERGKEQEMEREPKKKEKELAICSHPDIKPRLNPLKCGNHHAKYETKDVMEIWNKNLRKIHETNMRIVLFAPLLYNRSTLAPKWQQWMRKLDLIIDNMASLERKKEVFFRLDEMDHVLGYMDTQLLTMKSEDYNCVTRLLEDVEKVEELQVAMEIAKSNPYFSAFYENLKTRSKMENSNEGQLMALVTIKQYWQYVHHTVVHREEILASLMKLSEKEEKEINSLKDRGNSLFRSGEFRSAHEMFTKALEIGVFNYLLYGNRCQTSLRMENAWDALWDARRAVTVKPFWQKGHYLYARAFFELKDIDRALHENKRGQKLCDDSGSPTGDLQRQATMLNDEKRKLVSLNSMKNEVPDLVSESESDSDSDSGKQANYPAGQGRISSRELQELSTSEKPWKPRFKRRPGDKDEESVKTEELYRNFTSILNKLTPQLFTKLTDKALQLPVDTEERLKGVIKLTFEKAISEPIFSTAYAHMCQKLSILRVQSSSHPGLIIHFRPILVHNCQQEFEKKQSEIDEVEIANKQGAELKLLQEQIVKAKRRKMGNIRFIGELYKLRILTENIMHNCIMKLLKDKDDDSLECLCSLMSTIGKDLDHEKAKKRMDQYFDKINKIIASQKNQPRIQILMRKLVDLRKNNWVPRSQENKPTTIDALHRESAEADEGRNVVTSSSKMRMDYNFAKLKLTRMTNADDNIQLGPGGRGFNMWSRGPIGASNKKQSTSVSPSSLEEDSAPTQARSKEMASPRVEKKEEPTMTDAKVKHTSKATVDKFLNLRDLAEATRCVSELPSKQRHLFVQATVDHIIEKKQDMREAVGVLFHSLMNSNLLTKEQYLTGMKDMIEFAEDMAIDIPKIYEDLGELMGAMLVGGAEYLKLQAVAIKPLREEEKAGVLLAEILRTASRRIGTGKVHHIWQEADLKWEDFLAEGENVRELVQEKGVEFTLDGASAADNGLNGESSQGDWLHVCKRGLTSLLNERPDNDRIFDWIEHNISDTQKQHPEFIRALVTIICQDTAEGEGQSCRIDPEILKLRCPVLQRYIDKKRPLELQALYAAQALNHSLHSPPGLLRILFDVLYDEDVITEEAFYDWKKSDDPKESAGKGVALRSVTSFFTWLAEAEAAAD